MLSINKTTRNTYKVTSWRFDRLNLTCVEGPVGFLQTKLREKEILLITLFYCKKNSKIMNKSKLQHIKAPQVLKYSFKISQFFLKPAKNVSTFLSHISIPTALATKRLLLFCDVMNSLNSSAIVCLLCNLAINNLIMRWRNKIWVTQKMAALAVRRTTSQVFRHSLAIWQPKRYLKRKKRFWFMQGLFYLFRSSESVNDGELSCLH